MVLRLALHLLHQRQDAEDVFQAVFLALARKAGSLRNESSVAGWLHRVTWRLALRSRAMASRRPASVPLPPCGGERGGAAHPRVPDDPADEISVREARSMLHEELAALPERLRLPLVLCYFEGQTRDEAARRLGWSLGTFKRRLERGRKILHARLDRRGLTLSAMLATSLLTTVDVSAALVESTLRLALACTTRAPVILPPSVASLLAETALFAKMRALGALVLILATLAGAGAWIFRGRAGPSDSALRTNGRPTLDPGEKPPTRDRFGDPLPAGAIARLGTGRFRNGMFKPHFFPDGKTILTANRQAIQFWETATGRLLREIPTGSLYIWRTTLSADGKQAAVTGIFVNAPSFQPALRVWDVATGKEVRIFAAKERKPDETSLTFTPDGKQLVSIPGGALCFEDVATAKEVRRRQFSNDVLPSFALAPNGETAAIAPGGNTWKFYLWNWNTDAEPREIKVTRRPLQCLCFSPDSRLLAGCGQLESVIELWDVDSGKVVRTIDLNQEAVCALDLAFSPDGKVLAITDGGNRKNFSGGLYLWDLERACCVHQLLTPGEQVVFTNFSPDGRLVAATTTRGVRVWEVRTGRAVAESADAHCGSLTRIAVSPQGLTATASEDHTVRIWDTATGQQRLKLEHDQPVTNVVLTPDGTSVVTATSMDNTIRFWDIKSGKEIKKLPGQKRFATGLALGLTPDGRRLHSWADNRSLRIWDVPTGKLLREHEVPPDATGKSSADNDRRREKLLLAGMGPCCFSPEGTYFILSFTGEFRVYETVTGKACQTIPSHGGRVRSLAMSPDGRSFLASVEGSGAQNKQHRVSLWELATGKPRSSWTLPGEAAGPVALSHDGRRLAVGLPGVPGAIRLFRMADPQAVLTFAGFTGKPTLLSFSPDDRQLISGMDDTSALVWQLPPLTGPPVRRLEREALRQVWGDLASDDAERAYQAILCLTQSPADAVALLQQHVRPVAVPDPKRIKQLIKDLDDGRFAVRSRAKGELENLDALAEPSLKLALTGQPSLEARRRIEELLSKLRGRVSTPRILQGIRAVEALERLNTPEARAHLARLAHGAAGARLTGEADAAVRRLQARDKSEPRP
jgi:RNA polymerase sigma factor (sigma-70 family)